MIPTCPSQLPTEPYTVNFGKACQHAPAIFSAPRKRFSCSRLEQTGFQGNPQSTRPGLLTIRPKVSVCKPPGLWPGPLRRTHASYAKQMSRNVQLCFVRFFSGALAIPKWAKGCHKTVLCPADLIRANKGKAQCWVVRVPARARSPRELGACRK